jgi:hypothetical protein
MAVRIEFFTIEGADDFERVPAATLDAAVAGFDADESTASGPVRCVGWLSASDDDEERFTDWCDEVDDDLGIGLLQQGVGEATGLVPPAQDATALASDGEWATAWSAVLRDALEAAGGGRFAWRTNFDVPGSAAAGDDYPTASHRAGAAGPR